MTIKIDTREKKPFSQCKAWKGVEYEIVTLKTADYSNGNISIERKSVSDFINCCGKQKERFVKELERGFDILVIEGTIADMHKHLKKVRSRMHINYIIHMMKEIKRDYGIDVIMCGNREKAAKLALHQLTNY